MGVEAKKGTAPDLIMAVARAVNRVVASHLWLNYLNVLKEGNSKCGIQTLQGLSMKSETSLTVLYLLHNNMFWTYSI